MPKLEQFAVILYTLRDFVKTPEDFKTTLDKVAAIGYKAIQVSGMAKDVLPAEEIAAEAAKRGLTICATHEPGVDILDDTEAVIARLKTLGTQYTAYPFPAGVDFADEASVQNLITKLDLAGEKMAAAGLVLTYHNHAHELYRSGGTTLLERIYAQTGPKHLQGEIDTHWIQRGGADPIKWIERLHGRLPLLHLKDYKVDASGVADYAEIGQGNLDFPAIVAAAEKAGCQWYIVEQDTCPGDPFESIKISFDYIKANLCS